MGPFKGLKKCRRIDIAKNYWINDKNMLLSPYQEGYSRRRVIEDIPPIKPRVIQYRIENVSTTMKEMFGITISEGEVQEILYQLSDVLGKEYLNLLDDIRRAPSRHMDTTSSRENGSNTNLWVFVTKAEAIFHTAMSNSHDVALDILGEHNGTDIHDRYSAFDNLASKTGEYATVLLGTHNL